MKTLRQLSAATILSATLALSVLGGQVETPGAPAPPPVQPSSEKQISGIATDIVIAVLSLIYR